MRVNRNLVDSKRVRLHKIRGVSIKEKPTEDEAREYVNTLKYLIHDMKYELDGVEDDLERLEGLLFDSEYAMTMFASIEDILRHVKSMASKGIEDAESGQSVYEITLDEQQ